MLDHADPSMEPRHDAASPPCLATPLLSADGSRSRHRFPLEFLTSIKLDPDAEWLVKGLAPARGLLTVYGRAGSGKSFVALDLALHVAAGRPWAGRRVRQAGVVYVASEAGRGMRKRIVAAMRHHRFPPTLPFALVTVAPDLGHGDGDARALVDDIRAQLPEAFAVGLVVLDTLARSMASGDESGTSGMGIFIQQAELLGRELGALVVPIHHMGKDGSRGMRGSSALLGAADAVWQVAPDGPRRLIIEKLKEEADGGELPFRLDRFVLGHDRDDDEISTCVVQVDRVGPPGGTDAPRGDASAGMTDDPAGGDDAGPAATVASECPADPRPPSTSAPKPQGAVGTFLGTLALIIDQHGTGRGRFKRIPEGMRVVRQADLAGHPGVATTASSEKSRRSQIDRYVRELEKRGLIGRHDGHLWLTQVGKLTLSAEKEHS